MKTALDSNILFDVFLADPQHGKASKALLEECYTTGSLTVCDVVYAELACHFPSHDFLKKSLEELQIEFSPLSEESCYLASVAYKAYRQKGGKRERILADFLIAGHAQTRADALATRDRVFYRSYFPHLKILEP